jgi:hypothetical protein
MFKNNVDIEKLALPAEKLWPLLNPLAFQGLAGEIVNALAPESESDPVALLLTILTSFGNACGRGAFFPVGATLHRANLFCCLVGQSAKARKGTSGDLVEALFSHADPDWTNEHRVSGLSSGEGVAWLARDGDGETPPPNEKPNYSKVQKATGDRPKLTDDKRLFIDEPEFGMVLQNASRSGNNLSQIIRKLWDGKRLEVVTKNSHFTCTGLHGSVVGHITLNELKKLLTASDISNGFANRFLWLCVRRSKLLPFGGDLSKLQGFGKRLGEALLESGRVRQMQFSLDAKDLWADAYRGELAQENEGAVGDATNRAEAQALRVSMIYALLSESDVVEVAHLKAALAVWAFARASADYIFGSVQAGLEEKILALLRAAGVRGLSRTEISNGLGRNSAATEILVALASLQKKGMANSTTVKCYGGGRPAENWRFSSRG